MKETDLSMKTKGGVQTTELRELYIKVRVPFPHNSTYTFWVYAGDSFCIEASHL